MRLCTDVLPGLVLTSHEFRVPLDHRRPAGEQITVFAREAVAPERRDDDLAWMVFFQGGPGFAAPRPEGAAGWLKRALQDYRVLLLDQRGTGNSTAVTPESLARLGSPRAQAEYLMHFRQDAIVADAELIRGELAGGRRWTALGQSFGGFCVTRYLSAAAEGLEGAIITGGLPPLDLHPDEIYRATYRRVLEKNRRFFARYARDAKRAREIADHLQRREVRLPSGGRLTPQRFQQLGIAFGASDGFERVHYLLEGAFVEGREGRELSRPFLRGFENAFAFDTNPIYALLHEAEYCQGCASRWSAERVRAEYPELGPSGDGPVLFTGEMVYPWMFEEDPALTPLASAAEILAQHQGWPRLYDPAVLGRNTVPAVAAVYYDDMYVERRFSEQTAGAIAGLETWVTNEFEHNGLRADGERLLDRLLVLLRLRAATSAGR